MTHRFKICKLCALLAGLTCTGNAVAQDVTFTGDSTMEPLRHDCGLRPVVGVHEHSLFRPTKNTGSSADALDGHSVYPTTFNHHPMMAYWNNRFWVSFIGYDGLSTTSATEASKRLRLQWSTDGRNWDNANGADLFPTPYATHHRTSFFVSSNNKLLATSWYSERGEPHRGEVGTRLVREIKGPNNFGDIYALKHNVNGASNASYAMYTTSSDSAFKTAATELLNDKLHQQARWEEDRDTNAAQIYDDQIDTQYDDFEAKAFQWYRLDNDKIVATWKGLYFAKTSGTSWSRSNITMMNNGGTNRFPGYHWNAKFWAEPLTTGRYAAAFTLGTKGLTSSQGWTDVRTTLVTTSSANGFNYDSDYAVISADCGPQLYRNAGPTDNKAVGSSYTRGLVTVANREGKARPNNNMWVTYSSNKETIWVAEVPKEMKTTVDAHVNDDLSTMNPGGRVGNWNIRDAAWGSVRLVDDGSQTVLRFSDKDRYDYARALRVFPESQLVTIRTRVRPQQSNTGELQIDLMNKNGKRPATIRFNNGGKIQRLSGSSWVDIGTYSSKNWVDLEFDCDAVSKTWGVKANGSMLASNLSFNESADSVERIEFRTGDWRMDDFSTQWYGPGTPGDRTTALSQADDPVTLAQFDIASLQTSGTDIPVDPVAVVADLSDETLRVMAMGDSMTEGTLPGGYRKTVYSLLDAAGATVDMVGKDSQSGDTAGDGDHWGNSGWQIADTTQAIGGVSYKSLTSENRSGLYDEMDSAISTTYFSTDANVKNFILLMAGTNDVLKQVVASSESSQDQIAEAATARMTGLLDEIDAKADSRGLAITVILSTIPEITTGWTGDTVNATLIQEAKDYNTSLYGMTSRSYDAITVRVVDGYSATLEELSDGLHPDAEGYEDLGITFFNEIAVLCQGGGGPLVTLGSVSSGEPYALGTFDNGETPLVDRDYTLYNVPADLNGKTMIRTANDDEWVSTNPHLTFTLGQQAEVFVFWSVSPNDKTLALPSWMDGFNASGDTVNSTDGGRQYAAYSKVFPAGQVQLGGNDRNNTGAQATYFVVVKETGVIIPIATSMDAQGLVAFGTDDSAVAGQDGDPSSVTLSGDRHSATLQGNAWKMFPMSYTVTADTVLEFTVVGDDVGELLGIVLDDNDNYEDKQRAFLIGGSDIDDSTHSWAWKLSDRYSAGASAKTYTLNVGKDYFTGTVTTITLIADDDGTASSNVTFSDIRLYEVVDPGQEDPGTAYVPSGFTLDWSDEFNGSALDSTKWRYRLDAKHWSSQQADNVSVSDGSMKIELEKLSSADRGMDYAGGGIISNEKRKYGYYELRAKLFDGGKGWHQSFWLSEKNPGSENNLNITANDHTEIDIFEVDSQYPNAVHQNLNCWDASAPEDGSNAEWVWGSSPTPQEDTTTWVVYGMLWTEEKSEFYINGTKVAEVVFADVSNSKAVGATTHVDSHVLLTAIASHLPNSPGASDVDDSNLPGAMTVDYFRYYAAPAGPELTSPATLSAEDAMYVRSGDADANDIGEDRLLIGFHSDQYRQNQRGLFEFDLSNVPAGATITSVSLDLTEQAGTASSDQAGGSFDLVLKDMGQGFTDSNVTWSSLTPDGGDVSGTVLSTVPAFSVSSSAGGSRSFASSVDFIAAAQSAVDGDGSLGLVIYSPAAESSASANSFYRFDRAGSLNISFTTGTEPEHDLEAEDYDDSSGDVGAEANEPHLISLENTEWVRYNGVDLTGVTSLTASVAVGVTGKLEFFIGSTSGTKIGEVNVSGTSSEWRDFKDYEVTLTGNYGTVDLFVVASGSHGGVIDYFDFNVEEPLQTPYGGVERALPGKIEAEEFDVGGEGEAYSDSDTENRGGDARTDEGVDVESCGDSGGGYNVGYVADGEWLEYTVDAEAGVYDIHVRMAADVDSPGSVKVILDGVELGTVQAVNTGDWQTYQTVSLTGVSIAGGTDQILRLEFTAELNLNWVEFVHDPYQNWSAGTDWADTDASDRDPDDDPDGDGRSNRMERALGTNPVVADAAEDLEFEIVPQLDGSVEITAHYRKHAPDEVYTLWHGESLEDLSGWSSVDVSSESYDSDTGMHARIWVIPADTPVGFATLRLE